MSGLPRLWRSPALAELGATAVASTLASGLALVLARHLPVVSWTLLIGAALVGVLRSAGPLVHRPGTPAGTGPGSRAPGEAGAPASLLLLPLLVPLVALTAEHGTSWRAAVAGLALVLALGPAVHAVGDRAAPFSRGVPGADRPPSWWSPGRVAAVHAVAILVAVVAGAGPRGLAAVAGLLAALGALTVSVTSLADSVQRIRRRRAFDVRSYVTTLAPHCLVHWDGPRGTGYQLGMWWPHLARTDLGFLVVVRRPEQLADVPPGAPVLVLPSLADLDQVVVPAVRAALYVNGATSNAHLVRHTSLTHVQLNHGDSDKPPSYNPAFRMYDKNFVAGQAAVDRFAAHGIVTAPGFFEIVGRPQVAEIHPATPRPDGARPDERGPVVLYAPTWAGDRSDVALTSLPRAAEVVSALVDRGCTVLFRPHPHALGSALAAQVRAADAVLAAGARDHGRPHQTSAGALAAPLAQLVNASDALVADVSSVVTDYLFSRKPVLVLAMGDEDPAAFRSANPVARAAYVVPGGSIGADLGPALDVALGPDPLRVAREEARTYHLGDIPDDCYADQFREALRAVVLGQAQRPR